MMAYKLAFFFLFFGSFAFERLANLELVFLPTSLLGHFLNEGCLGGGDR